MARVNVKLLIILTILPLLLAGRLSAQNRTYGEIRGTVLDSSGARIPGVSIKITNTLTGVSVTATSDSAGTYDAPDLQAGTYALTFQKEGFKQFVRAGIVLEIQVLTVDAQLQVGAVTQTVEVSGASPLVQTETSDRKTTIDFNDVIELPFVGRNEENIVALAAGANFGDARAAGSASGGADWRVGFNGQRPFEINAVMDGGVATYPQSYNLDVNTVPLEAIQELDLVTDNFSAEYGNGLTVFSTLTKSGTNKFHGSVYEFDQNKVFSTRNFFSESIPPLIWNQFGGAIGGPIKKDKAFFFFAYEGLRSISPGTDITTVPTAAERIGDFSAAGLPTIYDPSTTTTVNGVTTRTPFPGNMITATEDPIAAKIMAYWPTPNYGGAGALVNNYYFVAGSTSTSNQYDAKVDLTISSKNRLSATFFGTYVHTNFLNDYNTGVCANNCDPLAQLEPEFAISDTWTAGSHMVNEFRFGFLRTNVPWAAGSAGKGYPAKLGLKNPGTDSFPNIAISGGVSTGLYGGANGGSGFDLRENSFVPSDTFTWIKGKHIIKFGGEFDKWQVNNQQPWYDEGNFTFSGLATYNPAVTGSTGIGLADLYLGQVSNYNLDIAPDVGERNWILEAFVNDDFKVKPNLTLNIGLRYQNQPGWSEAFNRLSDFDPSLTNSATNTPGGIWFAGQNGRNALEATKGALFAPRIGFAYTPKPGWVVRGGYGVYMVPWSCDMYCNGSPAGFSITNSVTSTDNITPVFSLQTGPPPYVVPTASTRTPAILNGQSISYWAYNAPEGYTEQGQLGVQHQLTPNIMVEAAYVHTKGTHLQFPRDIDQVPQDLLGPGNAQLNRPYPQYNGISGKLFDGESSYDSLQLQAQKKASRGVTFTATYTLSKTMDNCAFDHTTGTGCPWQNAYDPQATWSLSQLDVAQRVTGSLVYKLPDNVGRSMASGGSIVNAIAGGWQVSGVLNVEGGVPFTVTESGSNLSGSLAGTWMPNRIASGILSNPTINDWFDTSAFTEASPFTYGNAGRDILRGPGFWDFDFGLAKSFRLKFLGEHAYFQLRGDSYDVFNHPNFGQPDSAVGALGAGVITSATTNRGIQVGGKIEF